MKKIILLFAIVALFTSCAGQTRSYGRKQTRRTKLRQRRNAKSFSNPAPKLVSTKFPHLLSNPTIKFVSTKGPSRSMNGSASKKVSKSSKVPRKKSSKAPVQTKSTKSPKVHKHKKGLRAKIDTALPFMRTHATSLQDLDALKSNYHYTPRPSETPLFVASAGTTTCKNKEYVTKEGNDCRWIGQEEVRRQQYCLDFNVVENCPQVCGKCCEDDAEFTFTFTKNCSWLRNPKTSSEFVDRQCSFQDVQNACPVGCNLCTIGDAGCEDDDAFVVKTEVKDCAWLASQTDTKKEQKCRTYSIQDACQVTCETCMENVTHRPSQEPSISPTIVISLSPSQEPSFRPPTVDSLSPSRVPSFRPTTVDSVSPSQVPTTLLTSSSPSESTVNEVSGTPSAETTLADCGTPTKNPNNPTKTQCKDDPYYDSPFGINCGCELFKGTNCSDWSALLNATQVQNIWDSCPVSCGVDCDGRSDMCLDDDTYKSPANTKYGCEIYEGNCSTRWASMLNETELEDALARCPVACGVPCTDMPSSNPSQSPSMYESDTPSSRPSVHLSAIPTIVSSSIPSATASDIQTIVASTMPTVTTSSVPTVTSSSSPSVVASLVPTITSSNMPSATASDIPTIVASTMPTMTGSTFPSVVASSVPTITSSNMPSATASDIPTIVASTMPTVTASSVPTVTRSSPPSVVASLVPTITSSNMPSATASDIPTIVASSMPTVTASTFPSVVASLVPTITSSDMPSLAISNLPSVKASSAPSIINSSLPTITASVIPTQCSDDTSYRSPVNSKFGCEMYCGTDCFKWGQMLNFTEVEEIFTRCPVSCKVPCDYIFPKVVPSSAPTSSLSGVPSIVPSVSKSSQPTKSISLSPSFVSSEHPSVSWNPSQAPSHTMTPSAFPSAAPSKRCGIPDNERISAIFEKLKLVSAPELLSDPTTPQGKAMNWLVDDDEAFLCPNEIYACPNRLPERYALAVTYFATGGAKWTQCSRSDQLCGSQNPFNDATNFLSGNHECTWAGIGCWHKSNCVNIINFEANNIVGTIPSEISALVQLEYWAMEQGGLFSTIPSSIGALENLLLLDLDFNKLTGSLPSELFSLTSLLQLDLNNNTLSGTIDGMQNLQSLEFLQLHQNLFSGTIPVGVSELVNLTVMTTYDTHLQ